MGKRTKARRRGGAPVAPVVDLATAQAELDNAQATLTAAQGAAQGAAPDSDEDTALKLAMEKFKEAQQKLLKAKEQAKAKEEANAKEQANAQVEQETTQTGTSIKGGERWGWPLDGELVGGYHHGKRHNGHKSKQGKRGGGLSYSLLGGRRRKSGRKSVRKH